MSHARHVERVIRACESHDDERSLRLAVLDEVRAVVGFDAYAWLLTDPESMVGAAPLADVPCLPELPRLIRLKYLTTVNRWTRLHTPVALLSVATGDQRDRSLVWREMLAGYDVGDVASMVFRDRFGCWAFLDLWRTGPQARFTEREAEFLTAIAGTITASLRRTQATTFSLTGPAFDRAGPVVLVLSPELEVRAQTAETVQYLRRLVPPAPDRQPVPAGAYNVAAQLLAVESGVDGHPPTARVHFGTGMWLTLRAARIGGPPPALAQDIAVTIELATPADRMAVFVRACGLSERETELVRHLATGADTRQVGERMFLAQNTVQDHLKSIFAKTGARTRRSLLVRAIGP